MATRLDENEAEEGAMATLMIPDNEKLISKLEEIAQRKGVSLETLVEELLEDFVAGQVSRRDDPVVGIFDSGDPDIVSRHEDILRDEWEPD
jgi:hypothetical protein